MLRATCEETCSARANSECESACFAEHNDVALAEQDLEDAETAEEPDEALIAQLQAELEALEAIAAACDSGCVEGVPDSVARCQAGCLPCSYNPDQWCTGGVETVLDGNPLFFPIDGQGQTPLDQYEEATVPDVEYFGDWQFDPSGQPHNFHFTSELRFWFEYDSSAAQIIDFTGDDDVWVFVNSLLALDLGGLHMPVGAEVNLAENAATLGLVDGDVYEVAVFHAERQTTGSTFRLTLRGFGPGSVRCGPS